MIKKYLISYLYLFGMIICFTIIASILNYFFSISILPFKIIIPMLSLFLSSFTLGKSIKKKGYIGGIKFALIFIILLSILKILFKINFNFKTLIIFILCLFSSIIGSTIGVNSKNDNKKIKSI